MLITHKFVPTAADGADATLVRPQSGWNATHAIKMAAGFVLGNTGANASTAVTVTNASPGVITQTAHGKLANDPVYFTAASMPGGFTANAVYYVTAANLTTNSYTVAAQPNGTPINTSSTGTTVLSYVAVDAVEVDPNTLVSTGTNTTLGVLKGDNSTVSVAAGAVSVVYGTGANTAAQGNDSRMTGAVQNGGALGTPSSGTLTNVAGLPVATGISGLGTGVATALAVNVGSAGAPVIFNGALGTPSSGSAANLTGFPTLNQNTTGTAAGLSVTLVKSSGGTGVTSVTTSPTGSAFAGWDANSNLSANNLLDGFTTTATAAGTTALTIASAGIQEFTGTTTQTVTLPTTGVVAGTQYLVVNNSTGVVTVQSSGANTVLALAASSSAVFTSRVATPTTAANWTFNNAAGLGANTFTGTQTIPGSSSVIAELLTNAAEVCTVSATAATGTIALYPSTQSVLYYTSNASANWTTNLTFSAGTTMNTVLATGQSLTVTFLVTQGTTAYYNNLVWVDGATTGVTTKWQGGAPTAGNASGIDVYTYTIIKTANATFTVLASLTQFK